MEQNAQYKTAAFLTLGCKVNAYETEAMEELFHKAGYQIIPFEGEQAADIYVINTCTVTNIADRKSRQMLHRARKKNPGAVVVAAGCYAQTPEAESVLREQGIDLLVGNSQKNNIVCMVEEFEKSNRAEMVQQVSDIAIVSEYEPLSIDTVSEKTRAYIKIQDGCNQFCSYCMIPYVRGRIRSREENDILDEVDRIAKKGYREIVLTGIHLSSYGVDRSGVQELLRLLLKLEQKQGIARIRLGSLEPRIITEDFVQSLAEMTKICPHFHLSLQSGCDEVLRRMNRHYTTEEYLKACLILRRYFELPAVTTDVIAGFPGETLEEFETTAEFLKEAGLSGIHVFPFSRRKGTRAENMSGQLTEAEKKSRCSKLIALGETLRHNYMENFVGKQQEILVEDTEYIDGQKYQTGYNARYVKIAFQSEEELGGRIIAINELKVFGKDKMIGKFV